jgi:hypothetical protein
MFKFNELSTGWIVVLCIVLIVLYYFYSEDSDNRVTFNELDINKDGIVSRGELKIYLEKIHAKEKKEKIETQALISNIFGGVIRGFIMGLLLADLEGGFALALVLGIVNPIVANIEKVVM